METTPDEMITVEQHVDDPMWDRTILPFLSLDCEDENCVFVKQTSHERHANSIVGWVMRELRRHQRPLLSSSVKPQPVHLLNFFEKMPYDIVFMILQLLHPVDLFHLTQTSRSIRSLLTTPESFPIWTAAYHQEPLMPRCPPPLSQHRWAHLLFGAMRCEACSAPVDKTNFGLGQRLCSTCAEPTMVSPTSWDGETGDGVLWSVIPYASFFSGNGDDVPTSEAYLKSDVIKVSGDISRFKALVAANDEGAKESYEEYCRLAQQIASIREKWNTACHRIFQDIYTAIDKEQDDQLPELDSQLKKRYIKLGFTGEDYDEGRYSFELRDFELVRHRRISTKVWKRVRRQTEHHMVDAMKDRLERERQILLQSRRNVVNDVYTKYRENCTPVTWAYHPPGYTIQTYEPFLSLIEDPSDRSITEEDCTPGVAVLPELVAKWTLEKIVQLASLLPGPEPAAGEPSYISPSSPLVFHALQKLDLATSVFHCLGSENSTNLGGRCLIGWEGAGAHLRCGALKAHYDNRLHFNQRGYDAAVALVELSGRDPKVTSAREMDADGLRFVCANCSPTSWPGRKVLAWRDAILHYLDSPLEPNGHSQETPPAFTLLTPVAAIDVKRLEQWDPLSPPPRDISWCCNLCSAHWDESATKAGAVSHVQTAHNIRTPVENVHYIFFASSMRTKPRPVMLKDAVDATYKCLRCHNNPKLWCRGPLMAHLRDKHETLGPNENEDWMKVERFLRTTPQRQSQPAQTSPDDSSDSVATSP